MVCGFLFGLPNGSLQAIFAQFSIDTFSLKPLAIGLYIFFDGHYGHLLSDFCHAPTLEVSKRSADHPVRGSVTKSLAMV